MDNNEAEEGPKDSGNSSFLAVFAVEPRPRYVSMRFIAFVVTYCAKHLLDAGQHDSLEEGSRRTCSQTLSDRILWIAFSLLHLLHKARNPLELATSTPAIVVV